MGIFRLYDGNFRIRYTATNKALQLQAHVGSDARILAHDFDTGNPHNLLIAGDVVKVNTNAGNNERARFTHDGQTLSGSLSATGGLSAAVVTGASYFGGKVGIGTNTPITPLNVKSNTTSSEDSAIAVTQTGGSNTIFAVGERATNGAQMLLYDGGTATHAFYTDGTSNYINAGSVGIGTSTPGAQLSIVGDVSASNGLSAGVVTGASYFGGCVGIGTTAPSNLLTIDGEGVNAVGLTVKTIVIQVPLFPLLSVVWLYQPRIHFYFI